jgi:hypothetical protein
VLKAALAACRTLAIFAFVAASADAFAFTPASALGVDSPPAPRCCGAAAAPPRRCALLRLTLPRPAPVPRGESPRDGVALGPLHGCRAHRPEQSTAPPPPRGGGGRGGGRAGGGGVRQGR